MASTFYLDFSEILLPVDRYEGELKPIKELFELRLQKYDLLQTQVEKLLGMQSRTLEGILNKSAIRVDSINIIKLAQFLGIDVSDFYKIYTQELATEFIGEIDEVRRNTFIIANFDIKTLKKSNFLNKKADFEEIERRIVKFFGLNDIYGYAEKKKYVPAFSRTKKNPHVLMREFWITSAIAQFQALSNSHPYSREELIELLPKIRPYTMNVEKGLKTIIRALYNVGVTVIYQPHLPTTQVRGATFLVDNRPCIAITDLNKNYATIWFALLHELYHVLFDYEEIERQRYHMTGENDILALLVDEDKANDFARQYLLSDERLRYILPHIGNHYVVTNYAKECQIHPCIIYSFYHYHMEQKGGNYWGRFKEHFPDVNIALNELKDGNPFEYEAVEESVKYLHENVYNF